jgi:holo-[acyl-carrier protein] synthase
MNIKAHGVDLVETARLQDAIDRHGQAFLERVFTEGERAYCIGKKRQIEHLAGRFAAKEAVLKVLGTGWSNGIAWTDIEVVRDGDGAPSVVLHGRCKEIAESLGIATIFISLSHTESMAMASAIGVE